MLERSLALFIGTFTTMLAVINPLESLPIYLKLLAGSKGKHKGACITTRAYSEWFSKPEMMAALL